MQELVLTPPLPRPWLSALGADAGPGRTRDTPRQGGGHAVPRGGTAGATLGGRHRLLSHGALEGDGADVLLLEERLGGDRIGHLGEVDGNLSERDALQDPLGRVSVEVVAILAAAPSGVSVRTALGVEPPPLGRRPVLALLTLQQFLLPSSWAIETRTIIVQHKSYFVKYF